MKNKVPKEVKSALEVLTDYCKEFKDCDGCNIFAQCVCNFCELDTSKIIADNEEDK